MERFLVEWWPFELGHVPRSLEAVALMRLVLQVQSPAAQHAVVEVSHTSSFLLCTCYAQASFT